MVSESGFVFPNDVEVRRTWFNDQWWYHLDDVVLSFVYPENAKELLLRVRNSDLEFDKWCKANSKLLRMEEENTQELLSFIDLEGVFRVIQSLPLASTEPFKLWLAKLAKLRLNTLEDYN